MNISGPACFFLCFAAIVSAVFLALPAAAQVAASVPAETKFGPVAGVLKDGVASFKGIPYAAPPIGDLRFAPPEDPAAWTEPKDASNYGPIAPQLPSHFLDDDPKAIPPKSEDCLTLNVWTPEGFTPDSKLPVYVFIHGGGFADGASSQSLYEGSVLAKEGIVVVTVNYRLGALGFLASRETYKRYRTTGNWGLLDQIKALEWVRDNIASFGGDPEKVTVGGESAGSMSTSYLILSPLAKGLFQGAIMESGTFLAIENWPANYSRGKLEPAMAQGGLILGLLNLADTSDGLKAARKLDHEYFTAVTPFTSGCTPVPFSLAPVNDGHVNPKDPQKALAEGNFNKVRLLIGFNTDEGSLFVGRECSEDDLRSMIIYNMGPDASKAIWSRYPIDSQHPLLERARFVLASSTITAGMKRVADLHSRFNNVYLYNYDYRTKKSDKDGLGAYHTSELALVFGHPELMGYSTSYELKLASEMRSRWVNFIKTGDPNQGSGQPAGAVWPAYDSGDPQAFVFGKTLETKPLLGKEDLDFMADTLYGPLPPPSSK